MSDVARAFAASRGGVVFVRAHSHRCCAGPLTLLDTTTAPPSDASQYVGVSSDGISVLYGGAPESGPHVLTIELRGRLRDRLVSYWDGCVAKL